MRQDKPYTAAATAAAANPGGAGRVLLVDDSRDVRRLLGYYLRAIGAEVVEATGGRAACDAAFDAQNRGADFDLILLDMEMPDLDGRAAATLLRMQGFAGPLVALTANDAAGDRERCLASGCSAYLCKPVERDVLIEVVRGHLGARASRAADGDRPLRATELAEPGEALPAEIEPFVRAFLAALPGYAGTLEDLLRRRAIDQLAQTVHQIKGAAGMYGFERMYDVATGAESVAKALARAGTDMKDDAATGGRLHEEIGSLIRIIRSTCAGSERTKETAGARG